jgi:hypothetical protein
VAVDTETLPDVQNAWALLGISGGSYVLGKNIQLSAETAQKGQMLGQQPAPAPQRPPAATPPPTPVQ